MTRVDEAAPAQTDAQLWIALGPELLRYARVLVGRADAHDVVVEAFLRASRAGWASMSSPRAYMYKAVTNEARNFGRRELRRKARDTNAVLADRPPAAEALIDVRLAVSRLSVRQRAVIYLSYWRDLPDHEIAVLLDMSRSSVRRHHDRARQHLREALR